MGAPEGEDSPETGILRIEGEGDQQLNAAYHVIVHNFSVRNSVAFRSTPTIGGPNYIFAFGDNVASLSVSVTMFQGYGCLSEGQEQDLNGILSSFQFYANNRIMPTVAPLVKIVYGGVNITGFLVGFSPASQGGGQRLVHQAVFELIGWVDEPWFGRSQGQGSGASSADSGGGGSTSDSNGNPSQETDSPPKTQNTPPADGGAGDSGGGNPAVPTGSQSDSDDQTEVSTPEEARSSDEDVTRMIYEYEQAQRDLKVKYDNKELSIKEYSNDWANLRESYGYPPNDGDPYDNDRARYRHFKARLYK